MPTTAGSNNFTVPQATDPFNPPADFAALATDISSKVGGGAEIVTTVTAMNAIPSTRLFPGKMARVTSDGTASNNGDYVWNGTTWAQQTGDTGWVTMAVNTSAGYTAGSPVPASRVKNGRATINGQFTKAAGLASGDVFAPLPAGITIPTSHQKRYIVPCTGAVTARISVTSAGLAIEALSGTGATYLVFEIEFELG